MSYIVPTDFERSCCGKIRTTEEELETTPALKISKMKITLKSYFLNPKDKRGKKLRRLLGKFIVHVVSIFLITTQVSFLILMIVNIPYSLEYTPPSNISPPSILPQICCTGTLHLKLTPPSNTKCVRVHVQLCQIRQTNTD